MGQIGPFVMREASGELAPIPDLPALTLEQGGSTCTAWPCPDRLQVGHTRSRTLANSISYHPLHRRVNARAATRRPEPVPAVGIDCTN
jgi:hypothetical protein